MQVGNVVLFIPRLKGWSHKLYMIGVVTHVYADVVQIVDVCGTKHHEYTAKVVLLHQVRQNIVQHNTVDNIEKDIPV